MKQPHINCSPKDIQDLVIVCGDPARVERIAALGAHPRHISTNREFTVYETTYNHHLVTICSTGIGGVSALIALEELIRCGAKSIIRVGSAGALQTEIKLGDIIVAEGAVRHDGASAAYIEPAYPAIADFGLTTKIAQYLANQQIHYTSGLIRSHDSFYTEAEEQICAKWSNLGLLAADMETASLLTLGRLRGIKVAAVLCNVVEYQADLESSIVEYKDSTQLLVQSETNASSAALAALTMDLS